MTEKQENVEARVKYLVKEIERHNTSTIMRLQKSQMRNMMLWRMSYENLIPKTPSCLKSVWIAQNYSLSVSI